ncbi:SagB/ThcOx family dehydrogenase [Pyrococcus abyssi]|uniref:Nitroreductase n=1 Tax=Pyrococcus abyssi (strain GE5 / Orsay) TaxID=272844 RepID=Q9V092_PYRAB|nr:SagB/ThcOx family dehydrogenase [Pyrococcus abyssi]CAB49813.1 Nitroreductase [Pyrococcus abyssi GE5]CCE70306.1 TPA: Putative NADH oxidase [Pyrococcus abyssi GE5]
MEIKLPRPKTKGNVSLEEAIFKRRSIRKYLSEPISLEELSQILWAAAGVNSWGKRNYPSAGARYPLEVYAVVGNVEGIKPGIYYYNWREHSLVLVREGDIRKELYRACLEQECVLNAPVSIVIVAHYERTTSKYGERGIRYVHLDCGHMGQNIYLQATALNLGTVAVGAFRDDEVRKVLGVDGDPLYVFPIGKPGE